MNLYIEYDEYIGKITVLFFTLSKLKYCPLPTHGVPKINIVKHHALIYLFVIPIFSSEPPSLAPDFETI